MTRVIIMCEPSSGRQFGSFSTARRQVGNMSLRHARDTVPPADGSEGCTFNMNPRPTGPAPSLTRLATVSQKSSPKTYTAMSDATLLFRVIFVTAIPHQPHARVQAHLRRGIHPAGLTRGPRGRQGGLRRDIHVGVLSHGIMVKYQSDYCRRMSGPPTYPWVVTSV